MSVTKQWRGACTLQVRREPRSRYVRAATARSRTLSRNWEDELRIKTGEHGGEWTASGLLKDALKLDGKIQLDPGDKLVGSASIDSAGIALARTHGPHGTRLRIGIGIEDTSSWRGANRGATVVLDEAGTDRLREAVAGMLVTGKATKARLIDAVGRAEALVAQRRAVARRQYPTLTAANARKLDRMDEQLEEISSRLENVQKRQAERLQPNDWFDPNNWRDVRDREIFTARDAAEETKLQRQHDELSQQRGALAGDPVPLSVEDQAELAHLNGDIEATWAEYWAAADGLEVASGSISGDWGQIEWSVSGNDDPGASYSLRVGDSESDPSASDLSKLVRLLGKTSPPDATRSWSQAQAALHPRDAGNKRFIPTADRIAAALHDWLNGSNDEPLKPFTREQVRTVAKARGLTPKRGASEDDIKDLLLADARQAFGDRKAKARSDYQALADRKPHAEAGAELSELLAKGADHKTIAEHIRAHASGPSMDEVETSQRLAVVADLETVASAFDSGDENLGAERMAAVLKAHDLTLSDSAGKTVAFDENTHRPVGDVPADGAKVTVLRPGVTYRRAGGDVVLSEPLVTTATGRTPRKTAVKRAPAKAAPSAPLPPKTDEPAEGADALAAAPASLVTGRGLTPQQKSAVRHYQQQGTHDRVNTALREGRDVSKLARVARIDEALAGSPLARDVVVYRGVLGRKLFGDRWSSDLAGYEWTDPAYMSTSAHQSRAEGFGFGDATDNEGATILRIVAPAGTPAIQVSRYNRRSGMPDEAELLLARGLRLRVVADRREGRGKNRLGIQLPPNRVLDVEIVPNDMPTVAGEDARVRQAAIDDARKVSELAAKVDELVANLPAAKRAPAKVAPEVDAEDAARFRQKVIDEARQRANVLAEVHQLLNDGQDDPAVFQHRAQSTARLLGEDASMAPLLRALESADRAKIRRALGATERKLGFRRSPTRPVGFTGSEHEAVGAKPAPGTRVDVLRPGYTFTHDGEDIRLSKAKVIEADPLPAKRTPAKKATPTKAADGLDAMDDRQLASLAREYEVPKVGDKSRTQLVAALRRKQAVSPAVRQQQIAAEPPPVPARERLSADPTVRAVQVENRVRAAYTAVLARKPQAHHRVPGADRWVTMADLRDELGDGVDRHEVDAALTRMNLTGGTSIVPESNQKTLKPEDRQAAVVIGDQLKHLVAIDDPSLRPLPASATSAKTAPSKTATQQPLRSGDDLPDAKLKPAAPHTPEWYAIQDRRHADAKAATMAGLLHRPARDAEVDNRLRAAYVAARPDGGWVGIADLRDGMADIPRAEQDAALRRLADADLPGGPRIIPVANSKALTPRDRAAALHMDGENLHAVTFASTPQPLPVPSSNPDDRQSRDGMLADAKSREEGHGPLPSTTSGLSPSPPDARFEVLPRAARGVGGDGRLTPDGPWGLHGAAGVLVRTTGDDGKARYLLVKTGSWVDAGGRWQLPGGALDQHESPYQGTAREVVEEVGADPAALRQLAPVGEHVLTHPSGWKYTTILADAPKAFDAKVDGSETTDARWLTADEIRQLMNDDKVQPDLAKVLPQLLQGRPVPPKAAGGGPRVPASTAKVDPHWRPDGVTAEDEARVRLALKRREPVRDLPGGNDSDYVERLSVENNAQRLLGQFVERHPQLRHLKDAEVKAELARRAKAAFAGRPVSIALGTGSLESVLRDGRLKSQLETGRSSGVYQPAVRTSKERVWFGLPLDLDPASRPIYGYLAPSGGPRGLVTVYGDVQVVLKDAVRSRTTAMVGDSMEYSLDGAPGPIDNPGWRAFTPTSNDSADQPIGKLDRNYDGPAFNRRDYIEAQIHGGVTTDDIAEVVLPSAPGPELRRLLEQAGVKWRTRKGPK